MPKKHYTSGDGRSAASKFGQMIGEAFESVVIDLITSYIGQKHSDYELLEPSEGRTVITLDMPGGLPRQMDTVVVMKASEDPVALLESKWLKDARHHNDKGAWILQLREVRKKYATVRGAVAILAGYWTEGVGVMLMSEGGVRMVLVATDEEVYSTLQNPLDDYLGDETFELDAATMRERYPRPWDLANFMIDLDETGHLVPIASTWLEFERGHDDHGHPVTGADLVKKAIDELLSPLPHNPQIERLEIALQVDTGNTIYEEFGDFETAVEFLQTYFQNPEEILKRITPRKNPED